MSGFFNFLKNLFSGLLGIFGLGSQKAEASADSQPKRIKRASGYFLELDDAKGVSSAPAAVQSVEKPATPAPAAKSVPAAVKPSAAKAQANPARAEADAMTEAKKLSPAAVSQALNLPKPTVTFASTYLVPGNGSGGRRRPGANMTSFLDMAKQVKTQG